MQKLLVVEDSFEIRDRGLVVVPGPRWSELDAPREVDAELRRPDGTTRLARVRIEPAFQTPPAPDPRYAIVIIGASKEDVPIGTEVWIPPALSAKTPPSAD